MALTKAGTGMPFAPVSAAKPVGSICISRVLRSIKAADSSGMIPRLPCTLAKAPSTSIIARVSALSENSEPISASWNRSR